MWPELGLDTLLVFLCREHGTFEAVTAEADGHLLPFFQWASYDWRLP